MTIFGTLRPKQNNPVTWLRHNEENQIPCDTSIGVPFGYVGNGPFPNIFRTKSLLLLLFPTLAFYFVPSLGKHAQRPSGAANRLHLVREPNLLSRVCVASPSETKSIIVMSDVVSPASPAPAEGTGEASWGAAWKGQNRGESGVILVSCRPRAGSGITGD